MGLKKFHHTGIVSRVRKMTSIFLCLTQKSVVVHRQPSKSLQRTGRNDTSSLLRAKRVPTRTWPRSRVPISPPSPHASVPSRSEYFSMFLIITCISVLSIIICNVQQYYIYALWPQSLSYVARVGSLSHNTCMWLNAGSEVRNFDRDIKRKWKKCRWRLTVLVMQTPYWR